MQDVRYIISEAAKKVEVEQHTLRYWEEELELYIPRNEMGHRYYREEDIEVFKSIKILKEKGYQLRAIKMLLPDIQKLNHLDKKITQENCLTSLETGFNSLENGLHSLPIAGGEITEENENLLMDKSFGKMEQFKTIMSRLFTEVLKDNNEIMSESISENVTDKVIKEMDYLLRIKEEREEERFKQFDRNIREMQTSRAEVAASKTMWNKKKKSFFKKTKS
jgi:Predicted transcriptional regulators